MNRETLPELITLHNRKVSFGQRCAETIARVVGSWPFIIVQTVILGSWVFFNTHSGGIHWDPYPYILLNLFLSLQAAYTAPMILMAQNRHTEMDREVLYDDYLTERNVYKKTKTIYNQLADHQKMLEEILAIIKNQTNKNNTENTP